MEQVTHNIEWSDDFLLGFGPMDETHEEFVQCIRALQMATPENCLPLMDNLLEHAKTHFKQEDDWMMDTNFPPKQCHMDEHAAVLASIAGVRELTIQGDTDRCRHLARELARWFPSHADHLDSALSHWMCKIKYDAKPLVFKRVMR
jgi:hemerythrin-like metal-binding protein